MELRDSENIVLWVDNCASQNKNWTLFSFLLYIVNSPETATQQIVFKYFEPGHTFMSADNFHHQIELSMRKNPKIYDFKDFRSVVLKANSKKVNVITPTNFYDWPDCSSAYKLKKQQPRIYLKDIVQVRAKRGEKFLTYKTSFLNSDETKLDFLKAEYAKNGVSVDLVRKHIRGITEERKSNIIKSLSSIIPDHHLQFWKNLPTNNAACDLTDNIDD